MRLIGLHGPIGAGKDTVASYLYHRHNFTRIAFAGPIASPPRASLVSHIAAPAGISSFAPYSLPVAGLKTLKFV